MSSLLMTAMPRMEVVIDPITSAGLRDTVKIIVGGAPVTDDYAWSIGAEVHAPDASQGVKLAKTLISGGRD